MFIKNAWYVAAWSKEVNRFSMLARTLLNEPVVMYRKYDGTPVALYDRCPHRFAPLSAGRIAGEGISCAYHGMEFNSEGRCVKNPTQPDREIQSGANVKSYPLVEKNQLIWIWMGEVALANPDLIPDYEQYAMGADYGTDGSHMHVACNYQLLIDNLLDLSHAGFIHAGILGTEHFMNNLRVVDTAVSDRQIIEKRIVEDGPAVPAFKAAANDFEGNVDLWMDAQWDAVASYILDVGVTPTGKERDEGWRTWALHCMTPETATTTNYFWGVAHSYRTNDVSVTKFWMEGLAFAFSQDKDILEKTQQSMGEEWDVLAMNPVINEADRAAVMARRMLKKMLTEEKQSQA